MKFDPTIHHRRSIRLKNYDYSQPGAYFVTLVTQNRANLFGEIADGVMRLNDLGEIVRSTWLRLQDFFSIYHDEWLIMPNHLHAIIWIFDPGGTGEASTQWNWVDASPQRLIAGESSPQRLIASDSSPQRLIASESSPQRQPIGTRSGSLGAIIQNFKSISTRKINQAQHSPGTPTWQRNYYEHITRNQAELERIRQYIADNPRHWAENEENPR
jgi:putative transposase